MFLVSGRSTSFVDFPFRFRDVLFLSIWSVYSVFRFSSKVVPGSSEYIFLFNTSTGCLKKR